MRCDPCMFIFIFCYPIFLLVKKITHIKFNLKISKYKISCHLKFLLCINQLSRQNINLPANILVINFRFILFLTLCITFIIFLTFLLLPYLFSLYTRVKHLISFETFFKVIFTLSYQIINTIFWF